MRQALLGRWKMERGIACWLLEKWLKGILGVVTLPSFALSVTVRKKAGWDGCWGHLWWILLMSFDNLFFSSSRYMKDYDCLTLEVTPVHVSFLGTEKWAGKKSVISCLKHSWPVFGSLILIRLLHRYVCLHILSLFILKEKELNQT